MKQAIPTEELVHGEYYWGIKVGERNPRVARWDECTTFDDPKGVFVTWERGVFGMYLIDVTTYEFIPLEVVTWGVDEIPLED